MKMKAILQQKNIRFEGNSQVPFLHTHTLKDTQTHSYAKSVIPKVCSADHWWSARLAQMVRQSLFKSIYCAPRSAKIFKWSVHPKVWEPPL